MKNHLNNQDNKCWEDFFENPHQHSTKRTVWPLSLLRPVHKFQQIEQPVNIETQIHDDLELERERPKVKSRKRKM